MADEQVVQEEPISIPLRYECPAELTSLYATNIVVQHTEHEFILSFFQAEDPILLGSPEENRARLEKMDAVAARCIARIIVAPGRMPAFVRDIKENLERYLAQTAQPQEE